MIYQPIVQDEHGTPRFKVNKIVEYLLDNGGIDLNDIARLNFTDEDRMQFAMLIGYSVAGFSTLSYASEIAAETAFHLIDTKETPEQIELQLLRQRLQEAQEHAKKLATALFEIHPDDLRPVK